MLPSWFDGEPWQLVLEGGPGCAFSFFAKFRGDALGGYEFYLTDLATIWCEKADAELIRAKLKVTPPLS